MSERTRLLDVRNDLPLLRPTPVSWARLAAANLPCFLADHAICEQQAALSALNLVAHYPQDDELVRRLTALALEEVTHLRRVSALLHRRGLSLCRRRTNPWVKALRERMSGERKGLLKVDRLLVGALIEARSCERFTLLAEQLQGRDPEVADLLHDLGPAERRHWELFHRLAGRDADPEWLSAHWRGWLEFERDLASGFGAHPTVHG